LGRRSPAKEVVGISPCRSRHRVAALPRCKRRCSSWPDDRPNIPSARYACLAERKIVADRDLHHRMECRGPNKIFRACGCTDFCAPIKPLPDWRRDRSRSTAQCHRRRSAIWTRYSYHKGQSTGVRLVTLITQCLVGGIAAMVALPAGPRGRISREQTQRLPEPSRSCPANRHETGEWRLESQCPQTAGLVMG